MFSASISCVCRHALIETDDNIDICKYFSIYSVEKYLFVKESLFSLDFLWMIEENKRLIVFYDEYRRENDVEWQTGRVVNLTEKKQSSRVSWFSFKGGILTKWKMRWKRSLKWKIYSMENLVKEKFDMLNAKNQFSFNRETREFFHLTNNNRRQMKRIFLISMTKLNERREKKIFLNWCRVEMHKFFDTIQIEKMFEIESLLIDKMFEATSEKNKSVE